MDAELASDVSSGEVNGLSQATSVARDEQLPDQGEHRGRFHIQDYANVLAICLAVFLREWHSGRMPTFWPDNIQGPIRPLSTGAMFPASIDVRVLEGDDDPVVTLSFQTIEGRPVLVGVTIAPVHPLAVREIKTEDLRSIRLKELVREAIRVVGIGVADAAPAPYRRDPVQEGIAAQRSRKRRGLSDEEVSEVARVARENPNRPIQAVLEQIAAPLSYSYRTAARWYAESKKRAPELFKGGQVDEGLH